MDNIFEIAAKQIEEKRNSAFRDNLISNRLLELKLSTDTKVIGKQFPQAVDINLELADQFAFHKLASESIRFDKIILHKSAKLTDFVSNCLIAAYAYVISKKTYDLLIEFNLGNHRFYPATVFHKSKGYDYYVFQFVNEFNDSLDFQKSKFYVTDLLGGYQFDIEVKDKMDFEYKRQLIQNGEYPGTKKFWDIGLKSGLLNDFDKIPDIFSIQCSVTKPYIKANLGQALFENKIVGIDLKIVKNIIDD